MSWTVLADLDPVATELASTVADLLARRVDHAFLTDLDEHPGRFPPELWNEILALGCTEVVTNPIGVSLAAAILAQFGYAGLPSPLLGSLLAVLATRAVGADHAGLTAMIAGGDTIATVFPTRPEKCSVTLTRREAGATITGGPCPTEWVPDASRLLVACRDECGTPALVTTDPSHSGTIITPARAIDHSSTQLVSFDAAPVTEILTDRVSDEEAHGLSALSGLLRAATLAGLCAKACELTTRHVRDRVQFGTSLAQLQAVRFTVADMETDLTCLTGLVTQAATHSDAGPARAEHYSWTAAIFAAQAAERILDSASQLHGGTGFIVDHPLHFFYRHAKGQQLRMGGTEQLIDIASTRVLPAMSSGRWDWLNFE